MSAQTGFHQPWNLLSAFCWSPTLHTLSFYEVHSRVDYKKGWGRLTLGHWQNAAISLDQRQPELGSTFEKLEIGLVLRSLEPSWGLACMVAAQVSKPQSVQKDDLPFVTAATGNEHTAFISVNKFLLIFLSFQESLCLTCLCYKFVAVWTCINNCWL